MTNNLFITLTKHHDTLVPIFQEFVLIFNLYWKKLRPKYPLKKFSNSIKYILLFRIGTQVYNGPTMTHLRSDSNTSI